jgi:hypothetical protein
MDWLHVMRPVTLLMVVGLGSCAEELDEPTGDTAGFQDQALGATVQAHGAPAYRARSSDYSVRVNGVPVEVLADVNGYDYAHFSMGDGAATIQVTARKLATLGAYAITPIADNLPAQVAGNRLTYTIPRARYTIVSLAGVSEKLIVVADPPLVAPDPGAAYVFDVMKDPRVRNDRNNIGNTTLGIQAAIDAASAYSGSDNGGRGIVYVPAGAYAVGNLTLRSDMELYLAPGATFFFASNRPDDIWNYTYRQDWTTKGNGTRWLVTEPGAQNIRIWGRGTLDGNALGTGDFQCNLLVLDNARHVTIEGVVLKSASKWGTMIARSDDVHIQNVKFFQDMYGAGENDAIDLIESQDVTIRASIGVSFDDPFSVKTYSSESNYTHFSGDHEPARQILVEDVIAWTGCHAFKIGQGVSQPIEDVTFRHSVVFDAAHAVSVHHKTGTAAARRITWDDLDVQRISHDNLGRSWLYVNIEDIGGGAGTVEDLVVSNIRVRDSGTQASVIRGLDGQKGVRGIVLRNIAIGPTGASTFAQNVGEARVQRNAFVAGLEVAQEGVRRFWAGDAVRLDGAADWSSGNFKGNCGPGEAVTGLSQGASMAGPHALRCRSTGAAFTDELRAAPVVSSSGDAFRSGRSLAGYDWDPGFAKNECGAGEYVSGMSQHVTSHALVRLRCARAALGGGGCNSRAVTVNDRGADTGDWDPGFAKGECASDAVVVGVSVDAASKPRRILCCRR